MCAIYWIYASCLWKPRSAVVHPHSGIRHLPESACIFFNYIQLSCLFGVAQYRFVWICAFACGLTGMGKTIQIISLLLSRPLPTIPESAPPLVRACVCSTLIVTPLAALLQWKSELDKFVAPGRLSVLIYHGSQRRALHSALHQYDVVLTTYQTIEQDFRKQINKHKLSCKVTLLI